MSDPRWCRHHLVVPVETITPPHPGQETAPVVTVVAQLCIDCKTGLPANWDCADCEWDTFETRTLCEHRPEVLRVVSRPCPTHEGD